MSAPTPFDALTPQPADVLLSLIALYRDDPRPKKLDLGVGVYRDDSGATPVMRAVKAAEGRLLETQGSKSYLGPEGDIRYTELLQPIVFGKAMPADTMVGVQTPGGTGALRLAAELVNAAQKNAKRPGAKVWLGTPTWPNHAPIMTSAGLTVATYRYYDQATQTVLFDEMMSALKGADAGDVVLLHGCCHNPVGADLDQAQWRAVAEVVAERGLIPLIDLAYQGLGDGLEEDAAGARLVFDAAPDALVAYSCDKNFGLYRERVGALYAKGGTPARTALMRSNILLLARVNWSMPPDHGGALVRVILDDAGLTADWRAELNGMRTRINQVRQALAAGDAWLAPLGRQRGMFSLLPLSPEQVGLLRRDHAVYMVGNGRANLAGLTLATVPQFIDALRAVR
ncbi:aromatic amino acid transaminase [Nitrospirillum amazonense]|uniref:amino acid aminotransferase n=1 Tax=Nitrospirillum amazonense TaxID=28077 RepID=UPI002412213A|nr:amino acid aminotransferase [Nitrospirillum amazonense]MDG3444146.1 aspartate/tyrosine/aromatic aminotransferase [Nitrospirillum amazonense]